MNVYALKPPLRYKIFACRKWIFLECKNCRFACEGSNGQQADALETLQGVQLEVFLKWGDAVGFTVYSVNRIHAKHRS